MNKQEIEQKAWEIVKADLGDERISVQISARLVGEQMALWMQQNQSSEVDRLRKALADIAAMKLLPGETDHKYAYNRCWHIAIDTLK
jgi:hypothetical protein